MRMTEWSHVLLGADFSDSAELALWRCLDMLDRSPKARLTVAHVCFPDGPKVLYDGPQGLVSTTLEDVHRVLRRQVAESIASYDRTQGGLFDASRVTTCVQIGSRAASELAEMALELEVDLIVVGTHGRRGLRRLLLGSVAEGLVRLAPCPVLTVRPLLADEDQRPPPASAGCLDCHAVQHRTAGRVVACPAHATGSERRVSAPLVAPPRPGSNAVDEASKESFPASDPPSFTPSVLR